MKKRRIVRKKKFERCIRILVLRKFVSSRFGSVSGLVLGPDCGGYHLHSLLKNGLAMLVRAQRFGGLRHLRYGIAALLGLGRSRRDLPQVLHVPRPGALERHSSSRYGCERSS